MTNALFFIMFPLVFFIHDIEEILMRKKYMPAIVKTVSEKVPKLKPIVIHLQNISTLRFSIIVLEEFLLIVIACIINVFYDISYPLYALFWGFSLHLIIHLGQAVVIRKYIPGLVSSLLLLPYCIAGIIDLVSLYGFDLNFIWAVVGFAVIAINLLFMHKLVSK